MKHPLHTAAAALLMFAGIGSGCAEDGAGARRASAPGHYSYIDAAFLSGGAFSSGAETYAALEGVVGPDGAGGQAAKSELPENGAHFAPTEYLFLTGAGFYSGPEGYPFSW